jgi:RHS repeat-associated protein
MIPINGGTASWKPIMRQVRSVRLRYIDDIVMHRDPRDHDGDGDFTDPGTPRWWHCTDVQYSTIAVLDDSATIHERITYDAYGKARHHDDKDVDGDGDFDSTDRGILLTLVPNPFASVPITSGSYNADCDLNRDGVVNVTDLGLIGTSYVSALAPGELSNSTVKNTIGWDGYVFNPEIAAGRSYLVRFRTYDTGLGRWNKRDPAEYLDGMNTYEVVHASPLSLRDQLGLFACGQDTWGDHYRQQYQGFGPKVSDSPWMQEFRRLTESLRDAMKSICDEYSSDCAPGCTASQCYAEAERIVSAYDGAVATRMGLGGYCQCGETNGGVFTAIDNLQVDNDFNLIPFSCWGGAIVQHGEYGRLGNHVFVLLGHICGHCEDGSMKPRIVLDAWPGTNFGCDNSFLLRPWWHMDPTFKGSYTVIEEGKIDDQFKDFSTARSQDCCGEIPPSPPRPIMHDPNDWYVPWRRKQGENIPER